MMSASILFIGTDLVHLYEIVQQRWTQVRCFHYATADMPEPDALQSKVLIASPSDSQQLIKQMPNLGWVQSIFAGVDLLLSADLPKNYCLTNIKGIFGPLMAEYVFSYILAWQRHHHDYRQAQHQKRWQPQSYRPIRHMQLLSLGGGGTAQGIARIAQQFGMQTFALTRSGEKMPFFNTTRTWDSGQELLSQAQIIVNTLPATPATYHCVNESLLAQFPKQGLFINVGRGSTVDEPALLRFLERTPKMQVVLDVFEQEPLTPEHPFWEHPQVTITPHVAAPSLMEDIEEQILDNISRYLNQQPLKNIIDFSIGY
ncbi:D-2-hydroxyacid dehydrogenase [Celerinatantimonas sp. YJH-8]|uniref:D-2-hydroxyacid dehydrogenase n=1 Tax=Celerinatantimonas sp. YJH-8 TaxID=3228714 RepID=UPI0038CA1DDB